MAATHARRLIASLETPSSRLRHDSETAAELNWRNAGTSGDGLPPGLDLEWLGTAGFRFGYEGWTLLVDPYLTRTDLRTVLQLRALHPDPRRIDAVTGKADAVVVGHTHFDHALDVPRIVARDRCPAYGSSSLRNLLALHDLQEHAVEVVPHRPYEIGPFTVTFVPSRHSKLLLGLAVPAGGEFTCDSLDGLSAGAYRCGQVWGVHIAVAGRTFYHQGSADLIEDEIRHHDVDYFLAGIAGRIYSPGYFRRILRLLSPRAIVPHHYDDFFRGLDDPMRFSFNVNLAHLPDEIAAVSRDFEVVTLDLRQTVSGAA